MIGTSPARCGPRSGTVATSRPPGVRTRATLDSTDGSGVSICSAIEHATTSTLPSASGSAVAEPRISQPAPRRRQFRGRHVDPHVLAAGQHGQQRRAATRQIQHHPALGCRGRQPVVGVPAARAGPVQHQLGDTRAIGVETRHIVRPVRSSHPANLTRPTPGSDNVRAGDRSRPSIGRRAGQGEDPRRGTATPAPPTDHRTGPTRPPRHPTTRSTRRRPPRIPTCCLTCADRVFGAHNATRRWPVPRRRHRPGQSGRDQGARCWSTCSPACSTRRRPPNGNDGETIACVPQQEADPRHGIAALTCGNRWKSTTTACV
jgi:hypothetical protein